MLAAGTALPWLRVPIRLALVAQAIGLSLLGAAGATALLTGESAGTGFTSRISPTIGIDPLTGAFLATLALVAVPSAVFAMGSLAAHPRARVLVSLTGLFPLAIAGLLTARDQVTFLAFWELMSLVPAAAILIVAGDGQGRRTVFQYMATTHLGGAGVWIAVLLLAREGALDATTAIGTGTSAAVTVAALIGFGTKAGLVPLHSWLPRAHPVAPSHLSALMSGVMIKVALYGMIRVLFDWLDSPPAWSGLALLVIGTVSALTGIVFALVERDLKRLLAFSSIENVGIVALALGAAAILRDRGAPDAATLAIAAALLHTITHAVMKSLLFLGAGSIQASAGSTRLDRLGGLIRRLPVTGTAVAIGAAAIAGVPALAGFASEWLTLQALVRVAADGAIGVTVIGAVAVAGLLATAALAVLCFVKVVGLVLLGPPRTPEAAAAAEPAVPMRAAVVALGTTCVVLGLVPGLLVPSLAAALPWGTPVPVGIDLAIAGTSLPIVGVAAALVVAAAALIGLRGGPAPVSGMWVCGRPADPGLRWTSAGFTKTLVLMLEPVLRPVREVTVAESGGVVQAVTHTSQVPHRFDTHIYQPVVRLALHTARHLRRIQSGDLRAYLGYLVGLVVVLLVLARTGAIS